MSNEYTHVSAADQARQHNGNVYNNQRAYYTLRQRRSDETLNENGRSKALLKAAAEGQTYRVRKLLGDGADVDFFDPEDGFTALHHAVLSGFEDTVEELIVAGADVNALSLESFTPLCLAALKARANVVNGLLNRRASLALTKGGPPVFLHMACCSGDLLFVKALLEKEAIQPQIRLRSHIPLRKVAEFQAMSHAHEVLDAVLLPLHVASFFGHSAIIEHLLDLGIDVDVEFEISYEETLASHGSYQLLKETQWTALMAAARNGHTSTVSVLLGRGSRVEVWTCGTELNFASETALNMAASKGNSSCVLQLLRWCDTQKLSLDFTGKLSPTHSAACHNQIECARILIENGWHVDHRDSRDITPLMCAANRGHQSMIEVLGEYGADMNAAEQDGSTALIRASRKGYADCVDALIRLGADPSIRTKQNRSACQVAAIYGRTECLRRLVQAGEDVDATDDEGRTLLMLAAKGGQASSIHTLFELGASNTRLKTKGFAAVHYAARAGYSDCIEALVEHGADLTMATGREPMTPLMIASCHGHYKCMEAILRREPKSFQQVHTERGAAVIHCAAGNGHVECVELLIKHGADINSQDDDGKLPLDWLLEYNEELDAQQISEREQALKKLGAKSRAMLRDEFGQRRSS